MPVEQRVVSRQKIGARPAAATPPAPEPPAPAAAPEKPRRGRLVVVVVLVVVLAAAGAAAWFLLGRGGGDAAPVAEPTPEAGEVLQVDAVSVNLADGHYLRLGLGLQLVADVTEEPDTSRALDIAIALYSGRTVEEVSDATTREELKAELATRLAEAYEGEVMDVYLTNYVTQ